jgi:hypothetical protein
MVSNVKTNRAKRVVRLRESPVLYNTFNILCIKPSHAHYGDIAHIFEILPSLLQQP